MHKTELNGEFFAALVGEDERIAALVKAQGCPHCGGPLHRGNYERKPRGGLLAEAGEAFRVRFSLCCGHCRRRTTPPSLRFLGRRVYLEVVLLLALMQASSGVPKRTVSRWRSWWLESAPARPELLASLGRFPPPSPGHDSLPRSLLERLGELVTSAEEMLLLAGRVLAPLTTSSLPLSARLSWVL